MWPFREVLPVIREEVIISCSITNFTIFIYVGMN